MPLLRRPAANGFSFSQLASHACLAAQVVEQRFDDSALLVRHLADGFELQR